MFKDVVLCTYQKMIAREANNECHQLQEPEKNRASFYNDVLIKLPLLFKTLFTLVLLNRIICNSGLKIRECKRFSILN